MSGSTPSPDDGMPSARVTSDHRPAEPDPARPQPARPGGPWLTVGVTLIVLWSAFFAGAVLLWLRLLLLPGEGADPHGYVRVLGIPFVLVAVALLWWGWRSVRALRQGRRDGWTYLLVLGGIAVAQVVMTAPAVVAASAGPGTPGADPQAGPPQGMVVGMLAAIVLGLASLVVGVLGRRSAAADDAETQTGTGTGSGSEVSAPRPT